MIIRNSETSKINVSWTASENYTVLVYGVYDYNPIEKQANKIVYVRVNIENGKVSHSLGDHYSDIIINKIIKEVNRLFKSFKKAVIKHESK